jgi:hypothetical protein
VASPIAHTGMAIDFPVARGIGAQRWVGWRPGFPSTFPPPDAKPRGTGRNGRGRQVTAEAVGRLFVHVTSDNRDQVGMGRDPR